MRKLIPRHSRAVLAPGLNRGGNPARIERGTRTLQSRTARPCLQGIFLQRSARRALSLRDSGFRRNDGVQGRNDGVKGRNGGVGFIRWMPAGFLHRLEIGNPVEKERGMCILFTGFLPLQEWQNGDHRKGGGRAARMVVRHVFNQDYP